MTPCRQGIAKHLLAACEDISRVAGVESLTLHAVQAEQAAIALYRCAGCTDDNRADGHHVPPLFLCSSILNAILTMSCAHALHHSTCAGVLGQIFAAQLCQCDFALARTSFAWPCWIDHNFLQTLILCCVVMTAGRVMRSLEGTQ